MRRGIQLVIFDFDGTLIDAYQAVSESVNYTLGRLGYPPVSDARIKRSVGWGETHLLRQFVRPRDLERVVRIYRRHHSAALRRGTKFLPEAKAVLRYLRQRGYKIAVASNRATKFTRLIARHLQAEEYFDFILCRDRVRRPKPFPDIVQGILQKFSLGARQAILVGDMIVDMQAAQRSGVRAIGITTGSCTRKELLATRPLRVMRRLSELKPLLERLQVADARGKILKKS